MSRAGSPKPYAGCWSEEGGKWTVRRQSETVHYSVCAFPPKLGQFLLQLLLASFLCTARYTEYSLCIHLHAHWNPLFLATLIASGELSGPHTYTPFHTEKAEMDEDRDGERMLCVLRLPRTFWSRICTSQHASASDKKPILSKHCCPGRKTPSSQQGEDVPKVTEDNSWFLQCIYSTLRPKPQWNSWLFWKILIKEKQLLMIPLLLKLF